MKIKENRESMVSKQAQRMGFPLRKTVINNILPAPWRYFDNVVYVQNGMNTFIGVI